MTHLLHFFVVLTVGNVGTEITDPESVGESPRFYRVVEEGEL
jgi:hypothetical protein